MNKKDKCKKGGWGAWEKLDWKTGDWVWEKIMCGEERKVKNDI